MENYYISKGIQLFSQIPIGIKQIDKRNKFKLAIKNMLCDYLAIVSLL